MTDYASRVLPTFERVVRTRGREQRDLAGCLDPDAILAGSDLVESCVSARADLLVTRRLGTFDLTSIAVPSDFDGSRIGNVMAAIGAGPHSALAAEVAFRIGQALSRPVEFVSAVPSTQRSHAERVLRGLSADRPNSSWRIVNSDAPTDVIQPHSLVVIGAPRGSWIHRHLFSPAAKLRSRAAAGTVMVRSAPKRVFHHAQQPMFSVGPHLHLQDATKVIRDAVTPVVDEGLLVGIVRRAATATKGARTVGDVMEDAPLITITDPIASLDEITLFAGASIPVVDDAGRLVASVDPEDVRRSKDAHRRNRRRQLGWE